MAFYCVLRNVEGKGYLFIRHTADDHPQYVCLGGCQFFLTEIFAQDLGDFIGDKLPAGGDRTNSGDQIIRRDVLADVTKSTFFESFADLGVTGVFRENNDLCIFVFDEIIAEVIDRAGIG